MFSFISRLFSKNRGSGEAANGAHANSGSAAVRQRMKPLPPVASPALPVPAKDDPARIISAVSHELRTPLNGMLGVIELFGRTKLDERQQRLLSTLSDSARLMQTTLDGLKQNRAPAVTPAAPSNMAPAGQPVAPAAAAPVSSEVAQPQAAVQNQQPVAAAAAAPESAVETFELVETIEDIVVACAAEVAERNLRIAVFAGTKVPAEIYGNQQDFETALSSLLIHATQKDSVYVNVRKERSIKGADKIRIAIRKMVSGNSIASAPEDSAAFEPQTEALTEAQAAAARFGAKIECTEFPDGEWGFEFITEPEVAKAGGTEFSSNRLAGRRALVMMTSETQRQIMANYLGACGADVITAASNWEAIELVRSSISIGVPVELVLVEQEQSFTATNLFLRRLREAAGTECSIGTIIVAGHADNFSGKLDRNEHLFEVIQSPVRRRDLLDAAAKIVGSDIAENSENVAQFAPAAAAQAGSSDIPSIEPIGAHVLVAEDIMINQEVMREHLTELGCTAEIANNGVEAVNAFERGKFDIVLMDCQMPEMDGLTASQEIRRYEMKSNLPRTPIIGVSAHVFEAERAAFVGSGKMDDFLCKPFTMDELEDVIRGAMAAKSEKGKSEMETAKTEEAA